MKATVASLFPIIQQDIVKAGQSRVLSPFFILYLTAENSKRFFTRDSILQMMMEFVTKSSTYKEIIL